MDRLGPWDGARRVAMAVSGGADSLALALLARRWGDPVAFIVDHGLRPGSTEEATSVRLTLATRGVPAEVIRLHGLLPGPALARRARDARYRALAAACRAAGLVDLLLGHHAGDQAETVLMRRRRGSGPAGLAGMASAVETDEVRLLRPLLAWTPDRLRGVVEAAGLLAVDDPTNRDLRTTRARLRQEIGEDRAGLLHDAAQCGRARAAAETETAAELAERVSMFPEGYAVVTPGPLRADKLAALLRSVAGRRLPVSVPAWLASSPRAATLAGVRILPAGRLGPGWLLVRERAAAPIPARRSAVWDGRFRVVQGAVGTVGALGADAAEWRDRTALPRAVLDGLPALRGPGGTCVPHLDGTGCGLRLAPACLPVAGAAFLP